MWIESGLGMNASSDNVQRRLLREGRFDLTWNETKEAGSGQTCEWALPKAEEVRRPRDRHESGMFRTREGSRHGWSTDIGGWLEMGSGGRWEQVILCLFSPSRGSMRISVL